jgi:hypothetical protein
MVAIPYRFDPGHRHHENRFLYQEPVLFISVLILFCLCFITKSIGDDLGLKATSDELKRPSESSEPAERKTDRLKRKDLRSTCVSKSQFFVSYSASKRVCCHCGARHNDDMDLCGTVCRCSNRLRASGTHQYCALTKS